MKVWLISSIKYSPFRKPRIALVTSERTISQYFWKKRVGIPFEQRAFVTLI